MYSGNVTFVIEVNGVILPKHLEVNQDGVPLLRYEDILASMDRADWRYRIWCRLRHLEKKRRRVRSGR